jgi:hypothetical protein
LDEIFFDLDQKFFFFGLDPKIFPVIGALVNLVNEPEPSHPLRAELAEEYNKDRKKFMKNAEEHAKKHGEKRPE